MNAHSTQGNSTTSSFILFTPPKNFLQNRAKTLASIFGLHAPGWMFCFPPRKPGCHPVNFHISLLLKNSMTIQNKDQGFWNLVIAQMFHCPDTFRGHNTFLPTNLSPLLRNSALSHQTKKRMQRLQNTKKTLTLRVTLLTTCISIHSCNHYQYHYLHYDEIIYFTHCGNVCLQTFYTTQTFNNTQEGIIRDLWENCRKLAENCEKIGFKNRK